MLKNTLNDNVNVGTTSNNNDNVNDRGRKYSKGRQVEIMADEAMTKLGMEDKSRRFLLRAGWKLSEARFWSNVEEAMKGDNPGGLFVYLCMRDGVCN